MQNDVLAESIKQKLEWHSFDFVHKLEGTSFLSLLGVLRPLPEEGQDLLLGKMTAAGASYWAELMHSRRGTVTQNQRRLHKSAALAQSLRKELPALARWPMTVGTRPSDSTDDIELYVPQDHDTSFNWQRRDSLQTANCAHL